MDSSESWNRIFDQRLASLKDFLKQLYIAGGIPLVIIGLGAANMFLPYGNEQREVISILLIAIGALSWGATLYITLLRWKTQAQMVAEQDALVLRAVCDIARSEKWDVVQKKTEALAKALEQMGARDLVMPAARATNGQQESKRG